MRLDAPNALDLIYLQYMMAFVLFHTQIKRILLLGLGGGALAKFCHHHLPDADLVAVESHPDVIAFRDFFHIPCDSARFSVQLSDAALHIEQPAPGVDIILMDAFDGQGVAPSVSQIAFYRQAKNRLNAKGILVANISGESEARQNHLELIRSAFGDNLLLASVDQGSNHIVIAFRDSLFEPRWKWINQQALAMKARFGIDLPKIAADFRRNQVRGWESVPL